MAILIVEVLPYLAFAGAAVLLAWVGMDVLRDRKKSPPQGAEESARGLAGSPEPFAGETSGRIEVVEDEPPVEEEARDTADNTYKEEADEPAPEVTVSHAVDVAKEPAESDNEPEADTEPEADAPDADDRSSESDAFEVSGDAIMVRRDPSVRVFDTSVAASSRKVHTTGE